MRLRSIRWKLKGNPSDENLSGPIWDAFVAIRCAGIAILEIGVGHWILVYPNEEMLK